MRKLAALAALITVLSVLAVGTASADTPGCVSRKEFRRISAGDSRHHVTTVFDTSGREISAHGARSERAYPTCSGATVFINYANDHVRQKQWVRGE